MIFKNRFLILLSLVLALLISVVPIGFSASADSGSSQQHSFEVGAVTDYVSQIQTTSWGQEKNCAYSLSADKAADGNQSLYFSTSNGAAAGHLIFLKNDIFVPAKTKWMNVKVFIPEDSGTEIVYLYNRRTDRVIRWSEPYYFAENPSSPVTTDEIREKGKWVTLSYQMVNEANLSDCGVRVGIHDTSATASNSNCKIYIDSFSITDTPLDEIRYGNKNKATLYSFEAGIATDYVRTIQTTGWTTEQKATVSLSTEQAAAGNNSLLFETIDGAAKGQLIHLKNSVFMPVKSKWMNFKVFVPNDSGAEVIQLFVKNEGGTIKTSDAYYFADSTSSPVTTDEIRKKGEWVSLSYLLPDDATLYECGLRFSLIDSAAESNANCKVYIDSFSLADEPTDTIRFKETKDNKYSFEVGSIGDYVRVVQTASWGTESKCSYSLSKDNAENGEQSLLFTTSGGANKGQFLYLKKDIFVPAKTKWMNVKVFVPEGSDTEIVQLFTRNSSGTIRSSEPYYFIDNPTSPVITDEIRKKGEWITLSYQFPDDANLSECGLRFSVHDTTATASNDNCKIYIDSFSITDDPTDFIRYLDKNDKDNIYSFEVGEKKDYVRTVQTNRWSTESKVAVSLSTEQAADGKQSLLFQTTAGAAKAQYIHFFNTTFVPESSKWINFKVFVPEDSDAEIIYGFCKQASGSISRGKAYYFANNAEGTITEADMREKGKWIDISYQLPGAEINDCGLYFDVHDTSDTASNSNCKVYIDSFSVTEEPTDPSAIILFKPEVEIPTDYSPAKNVIKLTHDALLNGIALQTGETVNTSVGTLKAREILFNCETITSGTVYEAVKKSISDENEFELLRFVITNKEIEIALSEKIQIQITVPEKIDYNSPKIAYVDNNGEMQLIDSSVSFENIIFETDKMGYFVIFGEKSKTAPLLFTTVIGGEETDYYEEADSFDDVIYSEIIEDETDNESKKGTTTKKYIIRKKRLKKNTDNNSIPIIILIAGIVGGVLLLTAGIIITIIIVKKKRKKSL